MPNKRGKDVDGSEAARLSNRSGAATTSPRGTRTRGKTGRSPNRTDEQRAKKREQYNRLGTPYDGQPLYGGGPPSKRSLTDPSIAKQPDGRPIYGTATAATDPAEILLNEIRHTAGHIEWLRQNLMHSDPEQFVRSLWLVKRQSGFINEDKDAIDLTDWSQAGAMWLELYQSERRHLATICRTALAAGIEERRIRLAERQAERIGEAFRGAALDLAALFGVELDLESDEVRSILYKHLMLASGANLVAADEASRQPVLQLSIEE